MHHTPRFLALVNQARDRVKETTVEEIHRRIARGDAFFLVDVREDREWDAGHLPGAIHLGKGIIERDIERTIPDLDAEIVLYCGGGFRSALAADNLRAMGYTRAISMDGGYTGWKQAGYKVEVDD
jgi:rhodanese-related sulfurtransferase